MGEDDAKAWQDLADRASRHNVRVMVRQPESSIFGYDQGDVAAFRPGESFVSTLPFVPGMLRRAGGRLFDALGIPE